MSDNVFDFNKKVREKKAEEAKKYLDENNVEEAQEILVELLAEVEDASSRNNLALCYYLQENFSQALDIVKPNLQEDILSPFAHALATQCYIKLAKHKKAEQHLKKAISQFDWGIRNLSKIEIDSPTWKEYTVSIKRAAGLAGEHREVVNLHKKWEKYYQTPEDYLQVGVAYFNIGYYERAIKTWSKIMKHDWKFLEAYCFTTELISKKIIPAFPLEYTPPKKLSGEEDGEEIVLKGSDLILFLSVLFQGNLPEEESRAVLNQLISSTGEWGVNFGKNLLQVNSVEDFMKHSALAALIDIGVYEVGQEVKMIFKGEERLIRVTKTEVREPNDEELKKIEEARNLAADGEYDSAIKILEDLQQECYLYPAVELLTKLYAVTKSPEMEKMLSLFESICSYPPYAAFIATNCYIQFGDEDKALEYLNSIDLEEVYQEDDELYEKIEYLKETMDGPRLPTDLSDLLAQLHESSLEDLLSKKLPVQGKLKTCLRNIPVEWLDEICWNYYLDMDGLRTEREAQVWDELTTADAEWLQDGLSKSALKLLQFILANDGLVPLAKIKEKFGDFTEDLFWSEFEDPTSPLGELASFGLVFIGTTNYEGSKQECALIPVEIKDILLNK